MNRQQLEQSAIDAHQAGTTWGDFWSRHAADVAALELDYYARGKLIHKLVGLVASGDTEGQRPAGDLLDDDAQPAAVPVISDTETAARLLWSPTTELGRPTA
jgi:hypothetical protein